MLAAVAAFLKWDPETEADPPGFIRDEQGGRGYYRRRVGGIADLEFKDAGLDEWPAWYVESLKRIPYDESWIDQDTRFEAVIWISLWLSKQKQWTPLSLGERE